MWSLGLFFLLPVVLAADRELKIDNYLVKIVNDTLETVQLTEGSASNELTDESASNALNLTGLGIKHLAKNSLGNLTNLTRLNLANNSIGKIDDKVFGKLSKLEYLSLAENALGDLQYLDSPFANLRKLKILNLTNNQNLTDVTRHWFFGLSEFCDIITGGVRLEKINSLMFKPHISESEAEEGRKNSVDRWGRPDVDILTNKPSPGVLNYDIHFKLCMENGTVNSLDYLKPKEVLTSDCKYVVTSNVDNRLYMRGLAIERFASGWYRLQDLPIATLDFTTNNIARITPELLNDLPSSVSSVILEDNKIERVDNGTIVNADLRALILSGNNINSIENGAFEKLPKLENLRLDRNLLTDIKFVSTLPTTIEKLCLSHNKVTELPDGILSKLEKLFYLELQNNEIETIGRRTLKGLFSLEKLRLENNRLRKIESGIAQDLKALIILDVSNNSISSVETGSLNGLEQIRSLNFSYNKLITFPKQAMSNLSNTLQDLLMDHNELERLETGSFAKVPTEMLSLADNKIRYIEPETFDLPELHILNLNGNLLSELDGGLFQGMPNMDALGLGNNKITKLKNAAKNRDALRILHLSNNPLTRLDNNSLLGLSVTTHVDIHIANTPIDIIQAGVFGTP